MTTTCKDAEDRVELLIRDTNRRHNKNTQCPWIYELTADVHNIGIAVTEHFKTLRVNPSWLRFVVESGDFTACVADEIVAWYLIEEILGQPQCDDPSILIEPGYGTPRYRSTKRIA